MKSVLDLKIFFKFTLRVILLSSMICGLLANLFYHGFLVKAHETIDGAWLRINNETAILKENNIPKPSELDWSEHLIVGEFEANQNIKIEVDINVLKKYFIFDINDLEVNWHFSDSSELTGTEINKTFENTGNYFLTISLKDIVENEILLEDIYQIIIGKSPETPEIKIEGASMEKKADKVYFLNQIEELSFSIINPDTNKYEYTWDIGNGEIIENTEFQKTFDDVDFPIYVILRTTDINLKTFADTYVRLESDPDNSFQVVTPSIKPIDIPAPSSIPSLTVSLVVLIIVLLGLIGIIIVKNRSRKTV